MAESLLGATTDEGNGLPQAPSDAEGQPTSAPAETTSPAITPQESSQGETLEAKSARLEKEVEQARSLQAQADRRAKRERAARIRAERVGMRGESEGDEPSDDTNQAPQTATNVALERAKAERSMVQKAYSNPKYRAIVDADPTLKRLLETNPLALVNNPVDAEDAVFQLEDMFEERVSQSTPSLPKPTAPANQAASPAPAVEFTPGATNPVTPPSSPKHTSTLKAGNFDEAVAQKMADPTQWNKPAQE